MKKRVLAVLLIMMLAVGMLPAVALAEDYSNVTDFNNLKTAVGTSGVTITLGSDIQLESMLTITGNNITLDLNGHTLTAASNFTPTTQTNDTHLVQIGNSTTEEQENNVVIKNGTLRTSNVNKHVLNIYYATGIKLENLTLDHTNAWSGAPLIINASTVTVSGQMHFVTGSKSWYAINVDPKVSGQTATLDFASGTKITHTGNADLDLIKVDNTDLQTSSPIVNPQNAGIEMTYTASGVIIYNPVVVTNAPVRADLVVTRQPDGSSAPVQIQITFDRKLYGEYGGYEFEGGVAVVTVAPGESVYIHNLPANMGYDITVLDGLMTGATNTSGTTLPGVYTYATLSALPGITSEVPGEEIVEGGEELIGPEEETGELEEGTEETPPEEITPEEGLEEIPGEEGNIPDEGEVPEEPVDVPQTGDVAPAVGLALILGLAACAVALKKVRAK